MASLIERFSNVRRDEVPALVVSMIFFFCVLSALMVLRPAREALGMRSGLDTVRLLFIGTAVVTLAVNPVFGLLVARFRQMRFIAATYGFFAASLVAFWVLLTFAPAATGEISGRVFYVWFSVFNLFSIMVFWAVMADRFTLEQSKRLFGAIAVGGTLGAIAGPWLAWRLAEPLGTANLILVAVGFLGLAVGAALVVTRLRPGSGSVSAVDDLAPASIPNAPPPTGHYDVIGGSAWEGFRAVLRSRYLAGICGFILVMTIMATFIYFTRLAMVAAMTDVLDQRTGLFARIDYWTQVTTLAIQLLITGHLMRRLGVGIALVLLPVTVSLGFLGLAITGTFTTLVLLEASYRAIQRGITRPARETLFTVVSREDKYKAKAVTDTFVYRTGDVVGAWTEGLLGRLGAALVGLTALVIPLAAAWGVLALWLGREQARSARRRPVVPAAPEREAGVPAGSS